MDAPAQGSHHVGGILEIAGHMEGKPTQMTVAFGPIATAAGGSVVAASFNEGHELFPPFLVDAAALASGIKAMWMNGRGVQISTLSGGTLLVHPRGSWTVFRFYTVALYAVEVESSLLDGLESYLLAALAVE